MNNIMVVDKATGAVTEAAGSVNLKGTSIVKLPFGPESIQSSQQIGNDLVVVLKSGETVTVQNFFTLGVQGAQSQLVLENADGSLMLAQYSSPYSGFTYTPISGLDDLTLAAAGDSSVPDWVVWGLSLLGAAGAIAAVSGGGGGGGGG
ncbi:BapA/Bap/LapF family prefix-like domain-containing protein, partial [Pseudomonas sp. 2024-204]